MKHSTFLNIMLCNQFKVGRRFGKAYIYSASRAVFATYFKLVLYLAYSSTLILEVSPSERSIDIQQITRRSITENRTFQYVNHRLVRYHAIQIATWLIKFSLSWPLIASQKTLLIITSTVQRE